jgi:hypothetical protein
MAGRTTLGLFRLPASADTPSLSNPLMKNIHDLRFLNFALMDLVITVLISFLVSRYTRVSFRWILIGGLILGAVVHWAVDEPTALNHALGLSSKPPRHRERPGLIEIVPE